MQYTIPEVQQFTPKGRGAPQEQGTFGVPDHSEGMGGDDTEGTASGRPISGGQPKGKAHALACYINVNPDDTLGRF